MSSSKLVLSGAAGAAGAAAGANIEDMFSTHLYVGNYGATGDGQSIANGIKLGQAEGSGSAFFNGVYTDEYLQTPVSTEFDLGSGDFTVEFFMRVSNAHGENQEPFSFGDGTGDYDFLLYLSGGDAQVYMSSNGTSWDMISAGNCGSFSLNKWHHVAITRSGSTVYGFLDGVQGFSNNVGSSSVSQSANQISIGRGQNSKRFYGYLSDFHFVKGTAKYTSAFTPTTSAITAHSNTKLLTLQQDNLLTDNSTTGHTITEYSGSIYDEPVIGPFDADESGDGGMVWLKRRDAAENHRIFDSETGEGKYLITNSTAALGTDSGNGTFLASGFGILNNNWNTGDAEYTSWTWKKQERFFDVVTYTGTGSAQNISHNLGSVPGCIIIKNTSSVADWTVYHRGVDATAPEDYNLALNKTDARDDNAAYFNDTAPTSTVFTVNSDSTTNTNGDTYVAYLFAHNDGDGGFGPDGDMDAIKCGSYTGNGSTDGPEIDLGFEPQWILYKNATTGGTGWVIVDNIRGISSGGNDSLLQPQSTGAEITSSSDYNSILPNGFKVTSTADGVNTNGDTYIYMAIRRGPMAVPEDADNVFAISTRSGTAPSFISNFSVDMGWKRTINASSQTYVASRLTGTSYLATASTSAESTDSGFTFDNMRGWADDGLNNSNVYSWMWKRAPSYFDVVAFELGNSTNREVKHNLDATAEMIWWKKRSGSSNWAVFHKDLGQSKYLLLQDTAAEATISNIWGTSSFSSNAFYLDETQFGVSGDDCIAYLFATLDGVSKVGSFTHTNGTDSVVDCGFSGGARFVLMKATSRTSDWIVFDTERGIVAGDDAYINLNDTSAEGTGDLIDPSSGGFTLPGSAWSTRDVIYYAIA